MQNNSYIVKNEALCAYEATNESISTGKKSMRGKTKTKRKRFNKGNRERFQEEEDIKKKKV